MWLADVKAEISFYCHKMLGMFWPAVGFSNNTLLRAAELQNACCWLFKQHSASCGLITKCQLLASQTTLCFVRPNYKMPAVDCQ